MFLDVERARVQSPTHAKRIEYPDRHIPSPQTAHWIDKQLHNYSRERDGRTPVLWLENESGGWKDIGILPHTQEHVQTTPNGREEHSQDPCTHRVCRFSTVSVSNCRSDRLILGVLHEGLVNFGSFLVISSLDCLVYFVECILGQVWIPLM